MICGVEGIKNYFETGKGSVKLRGRVGSEEMKGNREQLVITEIPLDVKRAGLEEQIADLVNENHHAVSRDAERVRRARGS